MVSWMVSCIAFCALVSVGFSFPLIEEHQEIGIPETVRQTGLSVGTLGHFIDNESVKQTKAFQNQLRIETLKEMVVGHEEILDHPIGLSQELHGFEPKHATSYQSFHLESKHAVPVVIKTIHPPTFPKHFSGIGIGESFGHGISEIEPLELKHHGI